MGIMGPHINTREQAQALADACRYVPDGHRSFGSGRGSHFGQNASRTEYMKHFNENVVVIAQLEDVAVLDDLDGILSVDGIDYFNSGAQDIAQSLRTALARANTPRSWNSRRPSVTPSTQPESRWSATPWST